MSVPSDVNPIAGDALFYFDPGSESIASDKEGRNFVYLYDGLWDGLRDGFVQCRVPPGLGGPLAGSSRAQYGAGILAGSAGRVFHRQSAGAPADPEILAETPAAALFPAWHGDCHAAFDGAPHDDPDPWALYAYPGTAGPDAGLCPELSVCLAAAAVYRGTCGPVPLQETGGGKADMLRSAPCFSDPWPAGKKALA